VGGITDLCYLPEMVDVHFVLQRQIEKAAMSMRPYRERKHQTGRTDD
jgi:hypothetical protein